MTNAERFVFLESRRIGIGGSDAGSLLSNQITVEYGCERALWARLSGIPPDNPERETEPMIMGSLLEPWVARAYSDATGRQVEEVGLKKHAEHDSLQVHVDRLICPTIEDRRTTKGVLEIKTVGTEMMRKIQEDGLPIDYLLQWEHGAACYDIDWGAFAICERDDLLPLVVIELSAIIAGNPIPKLPRKPKILHFEMKANSEIRKKIEEYGPKFWATLNNEELAPPRLEPEDPRCGRCPRRIWCQGAALLEGIEPETNIPRRPDLGLLVEEYRTNMNLMESCEDLVAETENKFRKAMGRQTAVKVPVVTGGSTEWKNVLYRHRQGSERVDGRSMAVQYDTLRRAVIAAAVPGSEIIPPSSEFIRKGMPSRPLRLSAVLPVKAKKSGEVPEIDGPEDFQEK